MHHQLRADLLTLSSTTDSCGTGKEESRGRGEEIRGAESRREESSGGAEKVGTKRSVLVLYRDYDFLRSDLPKALQSLAFPEMNMRRNDINDQAPETCAWLLIHENYKNWLNQRHGLLWIKVNAE